MLWGVTDLLRRLLDQKVLSPSNLVVDMDPRKKSHLVSYGIVPLEPKDCIQQIKESALIAIFTHKQRYVDEILQWIKQETGRILLQSEVELVGII